MHVNHNVYMCYVGLAAYGLNVSSPMPNYNQYPNHQQQMAQAQANQFYGGMAHPNTNQAYNMHNGTSYYPILLLLCFSSYCLLKQPKSH